MNYPRAYALTLLTALATISARSEANAQQGLTEAGFSWAKQLPTGSTITIRNGAGFIHVAESPSERVEVRAVKVRRSRTSERDVTFDVEESTRGATVCTLYERQRSCRDNNRSSRSTPVRVEYTVLVPRDIRINVSTGDGEIVVDRAGAAVNASTGSGRVFVSTLRGPISVSTGNGEVDVRLQSISGDADVGVTTGNGSIRVSLPSDFGGDVDAQSGNGTLRSDFDITIFGRLRAQHIRGTIGRGNSRVRLQTGNGHIELKKL